VEAWGEAAVVARGQALAEMVLARWPGPEQMIPGFDASALKTTVHEIDADKAETTAEEMSAILTGASELLQALLRELAAQPGKHRRFVTIEDSLGWSRGRLASVLGGYAVTAAAQSGKRPYRFGKDEDGDNWMWVDAQQAAMIAAAGGAGADS
jgi:hypothetical protein